MTARARTIGAIGLRRPARRTSPRLGAGAYPLCMVTADVAAAALAIGLAALLAGPGTPDPAGSEPASARHVLGLTAFLAAALLWLFAQQGHYARRVPAWVTTRQVLLGCGAILLVAAGFELSTFGQVRSFTVLAWLLMPASLLPARWAARRALAASAVGALRTVVVGNEKAAEAAAGALLSEPGLGYRIAGFVRPAAVVAMRSPGAWIELLHQHGAAMIVLAPDAQDALHGAAEALVRARVAFAIAPAPSGLPVCGLEQTSFFCHDTILLSYRNNLAQPFARFSKVAFDLVVATLLLVLLAPLLTAIALAVVMDGGPVLYRHTRLGAGGRPFACLKFRSMSVDADAVLQRTLDADPQAAEEWRRTRKLRQDPRVSPVGRLLRTSSLDELPQLLNVLRLEMSLVGPRPIVSEEMVRYGDDIAFYFETRPGLTGLWQVSGRSDTGYAERVRLDTWYVKNWSISGDVAILCRTVPAVLSRQGAV